MGGDYYFPPCSDSVAAGMAHVCYGHAGVAATAEGEMLTVWRAPKLARGPLSPAILSLSPSFSFSHKEEEEEEEEETNGEEKKI